ncbi:Hsp33 family molecular chaperone [Alsobacter sp. SYSU M60028]|uniref:Hsp33 family molecular chaperone n=1 Tax=Alsobacter ponti TaxID=2962936 RepID=A0ABT1LHV7_9HYPH|nr:Hsp33 family molecular chaperone [Alsobacter ponti]MCP8941084.1 Hsp33 family molecular chaperone [Alsobacter ponti]
MSTQFLAHRDDRVIPFAVEALDARGRVVRLGELIDRVLERHAYPAPVSRLVGEIVVLAVLLGTSLKFEGRFQLQTRTDGAVDMLVVDFEAPDRVRAYARFDADKLAALPEDARPEQLLGRGHLALTIDQGSDMSRYQGIVALEGQSIEEAAHQYFRQSEQIPTRVRIAVGETVTGLGDASRHAWRAGGLIVQFLPTSPERQRQADLHPGDAPEGAAEAKPFMEDDAWVEARSLVETIEDHELLDPTLTSEELLYRLFHERGVRVFEAQPVVERCRCSRERIVAMLSRFTADERRDMVGDDGRIGITCEFCSTHYHVEPGEVGLDDEA